MRFARLAQLAIIAGPIVIATQAPATPVLYGNHYDETSTNAANCGNLGCTLYFSQLPSNKLTLVHRVTCRFKTTSPVIVADLQISATSGGGPLPRYVQLTLNQSASSPVGGVYYTTVDTDPEFLMGQSRYPYVAIATAAGSNFFDIDCTLSGELITPIQ